MQEEVQSTGQKNIPSAIIEGASVTFVVSAATAAIMYASTNLYLNSPSLWFPILAFSILVFISTLFSTASGPPGQGPRCPPLYLLAGAIAISIAFPVFLVVMETRDKALVLAITIAVCLMCLGAAAINFYFHADEYATQSARFSYWGSVASMVGFVFAFGWALS